MVSLVLFATSRTNIDPLHVLFTMAPKQDQIYTCRQLKSIAPSAHMVIAFDDEHDLEYVPPGTSTPSRAARAPEPHPKRWSPV